MSCLKTFLLAVFLLASIRVGAYNEINITFNRSGSDASSVVVNVTDENGSSINGVTAQISSNKNFKTSSNNITSSILCPDVNATASPTIELDLLLSGLRDDFVLSLASLDIHAFNGSSSYQSNSDNKDRQWNVELLQGSSSSSLARYGALENVDIADGVGTEGSVHKFWDIAGDDVTLTSSLALRLVITKGDVNQGCFFGLSQIRLLSNQSSNDVAQPFIESHSLGNIEASYSIRSISGKWLAVNARNALTLSQNYDLDANQEWYFVGSDNNGGWKIAMVAKPTNVIGLSGSAISVKDNLTTTWQYNPSEENQGWFYFTTNDEDSKVLKVAGDSLFCFDKLSSKYARKIQLYDNPCGSLGSVYAKEIKVTGQLVISSMTYKTETKPGKWHVVYSLDRAVVSKDANFEINILLSQDAPSDMKAFAYFDWNADGVFESTQQLSVNAGECWGRAYVPVWAVEKESRMRIRLTTNDLVLAGDEVAGFVYDHIILPQSYQTQRKITLSSNSWERGSTSISPEGGVYEYGTEVTITASPFGTSTFLCWKDGNVVISLDEVFTFDVEESMNLVACFSPNTDKTTWPVGVENNKIDCNLKVLQQGDELIAICDKDILAMYLYSVNAVMVAESKNSVIDVAGLKEGVYIVQVVTAAGYETTKVIIKN